MGRPGQRRNARRRRSRGRDAPPEVTAPGGLRAIVGQDVLAGGALAGTEIDADTDLVVELVAYRAMATRAPDRLWHGGFWTEVVGELVAPPRPLAGIGRRGVLDMGGLLIAVALAGAVDVPPSPRVVMRGAVRVRGALPLDNVGRSPVRPWRVVGVDRCRIVETAEDGLRETTITDLRSLPAPHAVEPGCSYGLQLLMPQLDRVPAATVSAGRSGRLP